MYGTLRYMNHNKGVITLLCRLHALVYRTNARGSRTVALVNAGLPYKCTRKRTCPVHEILRTVRIMSRRLDTIRVPIRIFFIFANFFVFLVIFVIFFIL
jgi:hypothetical protein